MNRLRVLIADDHPVFRYGLRALLQTEPTMEVVGEATTGDEAVRLAISLLQDVILMELNMQTGLRRYNVFLQQHPTQLFLC